MDIIFKTIQEFNNRQFLCDDSFIKENTYFNSFEEFKNEFKKIYGIELSPVLMFIDTFFKFNTKFDSLKQFMAAIGVYI